MLLNNYKKLMGMASEYCRLTTTTGVNTQNLSWRNSLTASNSAVAVGSGSTAVAVDDYYLENDVTSSLESLGSILSCASDFTDPIYILNLTTTYVNNGTDDVTVREVAFQLKRDGTYAVIARKVLPTPITIAAGETYAFNYTIK